VATKRDEKLSTAPLQRAGPHRGKEKEPTSLRGGGSWDKKPKGGNSHGRKGKKRSKSTDLFQYHRKQGNGKRKRTLLQGGQKKRKQLREKKNKTRERERTVNKKKRRSEKVLTQKRGKKPRS